MSCRSQDQICSKKKSLDSPNSFQNSNSQELFQSDPSNLVKWTKLISADYFFKFSEFYYTSTSGAFPCTFSFFFFEKSRSNIWGIFESTPQPHGMNTLKLMSRELRFPTFQIFQEKFGEWRLFSPSKFDPATGVTWIFKVTENEPCHMNYSCDMAHFLWPTLRPTLSLFLRKKSHE